MKTTIVRSYSGVIDRPIDEVRAQFADMQYHIDQNVHPDISFTLLEISGATCRFKEEITVVGMRQVDEIVNTVLPNGSFTGPANAAGRFTTGYEPQMIQGRPLGFPRQ